MPYPSKFHPVVVEKVWGGQNLARLFGKALSATAPVGELWEVADLENGQSVVAEGRAEGKTLGELVQLWGKDLVGDAGLFEGRFPLLIKFLDASQNLSVQVHPDEAMARRLGGKVRVKNEAWYIVEAKEDAAIYLGLVEGVGRAEFKAAIAENRVAETLRRVLVRAGDCYYLPSGTLHALGEGVVVAEIQTPSDTTYRVYDWGRAGREMHVAEALECIHFDWRPSPPPRESYTDGQARVTRMVTCESFVMDRVDLEAGTERVVVAGQMAVWIVLSGSGHLLCEQTKSTVRFMAGDVLLLPAGMPACRVLTDSPCMWLDGKVPSHGA